MAPLQRGDRTNTNKGDNQIVHRIKYVTINNITITLQAYALTKVIEKWELRILMMNK